MRNAFARFAARAADFAGTYWTFVGAVIVVVVWAVSGPFLGFSTAWQLAINTFTTITTFLMVFIIQNTQNRQARATQLKLDELLDSLELASDTMIDIEEATEEELDKLAAIYRRQGERARAAELELEETRIKRRERQREGRRKR